MTLMMMTLMMMTLMIRNDYFEMARKGTPRSGRESNTALLTGDPGYTGVVVCHDSAA